MQTDMLSHKTDHGAFNLQVHETYIKSDHLCLIGCHLQITKYLVCSLQKKVPETEPSSTNLPVVNDWEPAFWRDDRLCYIFAMAGTEVH